MILREASLGVLHFLHTLTFRTLTFCFVCEEQSFTFIKLTKYFIELWAIQLQKTSKK